MNAEQLKRYLERIGLDYTPEISEKGLDDLIWANLTHIPFENIDSALKQRVPSLMEMDLYEKIVEHKNGGYCFELNKIFLNVLRGLGFDAWTVAVRIIWQKPTLPATTHRASIVKIGDRLFLADVGYGGPGPKGVIELKTGIYDIRGSKFRVSVSKKNCWMIEREYGADFSPMLLFQEDEVEEVDYDLMNFYCARCEKVIFSHTLVCNLLTEDGSISLMDRILTIRKGGEVTEIELDTQEKRQEAVRMYFGLHV